MRRNRHGEAGRGTNQGLPDTRRELAHVRVQTLGLHEPERLDKTEDRPEQAQQGSELRDRRQQVQFLFQARHLSETGFLKGLTHAVAAVIAV